MALTKDDIVNSVYNELDLPKKKSAEVIESLLEIIKKTISNGEEILISGFGKFCVKNKKERRGRNPATGEHLMLRSRRVVTFRCSGVLRDKVNSKR
jgi:integration host factor subunit alpha